MKYKNINSSPENYTAVVHLTDIKKANTWISVLLDLTPLKNYLPLTSFLESCSLLFNRFRLKENFAVCLIFLFGFAFPISAQADASFTARLSPLPATVRTVDKITGSGHVEAILVGSQLSITGNFQGLSGLATEAHVHLGQLAIPGPAIANLSVTLQKSGELSGQLELSPEQVTRLYAHGLYIQIHSNVAVAGNLRGWLIMINGENNE